MSTAEADRRDDRDAVQYAINAITTLIGQRTLAPGQQLRQEDLADRLGLSRGPIREALKALSTQQLVRYERNRGYFVTQFSSEEISQIYWLRSVAESELVRTMKRPTKAQVARLRRINKLIATSATIAEMSSHNDDFHLSIYALSPQKTILSEVERWYRLTAGYRMFSLSIGGGDRVTAEHEDIIQAVEAFDLDSLNEQLQTHRAVSVGRILPLLPPA